MDTLDLMEKTALPSWIPRTVRSAMRRRTWSIRGWIGYRDDYVEHIKKGRCTCTYNQPVPCVAICPAHVDIPGYVALRGRRKICRCDPPDPEGQPVPDDLRFYL